MVFRCLCDPAARSAAFSDREADRRCVELTLERVFLLLVYGYCKRSGTNPESHTMAKFSQPDGCMISLVTSADLEASPCEFYIS